MVYSRLVVVSLFPVHEWLLPEWAPSCAAAWPWELHKMELNPRVVIDNVTKHKNVYLTHFMHFFVRFLINFVWLTVMYTLHWYV